MHACLCRGQVTKYVQRGGWSNRDLLRLAHPKPEFLRVIARRAATAAAAGGWRSVLPPALLILCPFLVNRGCLYTLPSHQRYLQASFVVDVTAQSDVALAYIFSRPVPVKQKASQTDARARNLLCKPCRASWSTLRTFTKTACSKPILVPDPFQTSWRRHTLAATMRSGPWWRMWLQMPRRVLPMLLPARPRLQSWTSGCVLTESCRPTAVHHCLFEPRCKACRSPFNARAMTLADCWCGPLP